LRARATGDRFGHARAGGDRRARSVPAPRFLAVPLAALIDGKQPDDLVFTMRSDAPLRPSLPSD
jgi:hypothetical protein